MPEFENLRPTICTHCRALDHLVVDCPSLKSADERRREVQCGRCGKMGHDIRACLDETQLKKEREMEEALNQKQKELERINKRMRDLRQSYDKIDEPIDKNTNSPPTHKKKIPSKRGTSGPPPGKERDESPQGPRQPPRRGSGAPGGGPPDDPGGSDDGDDGDDEDDEDEEETDEEDEEMSEVSELSDLSGFLYDMRGRRIDVEEMFEEWQRGRRVLKPHIEPQPQAQNQAPAVGRGRGRGGANFVAKKTRQPNISPSQSAQMQPPAPSISQSSDPIKIEPNPFLSTNPFALTDSDLPEIHEIDEEIADEELEGLTLKELDALQQAIDQELEDPT